MYKILFRLLLVGVLIDPTAIRASDSPDPIVISSGWKIQDAAKVDAKPEKISSSVYQPQNWYAAIVPGTVLTSLVHNKIYPEPLFGENNRPERIPESINKTSYWYRTEFVVPTNYTGKQIWISFEGINYTADVWVNGKRAGLIKGAFARGIFNLSGLLLPGRKAVLAVLVSPQPNPGIPHEHTMSKGMGQNGGISAMDGPTFLCSMGWDWIPAIRDRNTGIWQKVVLSTSGPVQFENPLVTSDLKLPGRTVADVSISTTVVNNSDKTINGIVDVYFGEIKVQRQLELKARSTQLIKFNVTNSPRLRIRNPKLWWPNGYGPQNLHEVRLNFTSNGVLSDEKKFLFGIRQISYTVSDSENLTLSVNGVRVFCKGGNWGMDEAMKRIPRERLEAQIRMHKMANYNMIRNWVGQSTSEDFYQLCDKYGILLWDEFFQPNPGDGPNPADISLYIANVREKILRFRNHASIAVWCARNEGYPPKNIDDELRKLMADLEPTRLYQPSSTAGRGVNSGGPYGWQPPRAYYTFDEAFKTEIGSMSIPTLESVQGMMPKKDWEIINDGWAEHDFASGAQQAPAYRKMIGERYGKVRNLADFVRKAQLANYEAYRAMYEGRSAKMFSPSTGVITWMSNPAQPSFVWQLYHHDLEPNAALFAARNACEPQHIQLNESNGEVQVINNLQFNLKGHCEVSIYSLSGKLEQATQYPVVVKSSNFSNIAAVKKVVGIHFIKLKLWNANGKLLSENFYWKEDQDRSDDLRELEKLPVVKLDIKASQIEQGDKTIFKVKVHNPESHIALMTHLQLRRKLSNQRVLPVYYSDNYFSILPHETKELTIEVERSNLRNEPALIMVDGWNIGVANGKSGINVQLNPNTQVGNWPETGLPIYYGPSLSAVKLNCGGAAIDGYDEDNYFTGVGVRTSTSTIDSNIPQGAPTDVYKSERFANEFTYTIPVLKPKGSDGYTVRLHWCETVFEAIGKRKFNLDINGKRMLSDFDVFKEAGGKNKAFLKEFLNIQPNEDGNVEIKFTRGTAAYPMVSGIEIDGAK